MKSHTDRVASLIHSLLKERREEISRHSKDYVFADLSRLFKDYFLLQWQRLAFLYVVVVLSTAVPFCFAFTWRFLIDHVLMVTKEIDPSQIFQHMRLIWVFLALNTGLWTIHNVFNWLSHWASVTTSQNVVFVLKKQMHEKLQALHIGYYERTPTGRIMSRVMDDVEVIRGLASNQVVTLLASSAQLLIGLGVILYLNWKLSIIVITAMPFYVWAYIILIPKIRQTNRAMRQLNARMYGRATERISGIQVVIAFARELGELLSFSRLIHNMARLHIRLMTYNQTLALIAAGITAVITAGMYYWGSLQIKTGAMTVGDVLAFAAAVAAILGPVSALSSLMTQLQALFIVIHRVFTLLDEPTDVVSGSIFLQGMTGKVTFDHVTFTYPNLEEPVLNDFSMHIRAGKRIAIMGPSGSGKSTIFHLLMRFYDPQQGEVRVGGVNLRDANIGSIRRHVRLIQQEPFIFSGTVADNIMYGLLDATPAQIMKAAKQADLHDFIMTLPVKYETEVGENGLSLSGGQKQRLALATALLSNPEIMLLDDTTSALDAETEARIRKTLNKALKGRTSLIITQRISTARDCHRVIVLEHGKITQQGTHSDLLEKQGFYRRIAIQQGWVLPNG